MDSATVLKIAKHRHSQASRVRTVEFADNSVEVQQSLCGMLTDTITGIKDGALSGLGGLGGGERAAQGLLLRVLGRRHL